MKITKIEKVGIRPVYDISVADAEHYVLKNGVVTHNTGGVYSSNTIWIITKSQEKDGGDLIGFTFTINIEKSRTVIEKSKIPLTVTFEGGINKYSGLLELAMQSGHVVKPSNGWYQLVDKETGELIGGKVRHVDTQSEEFLGVVLKSKSFEKFVKDTYQLNSKILTEPTAIPVTDDLTDDDMELVAVGE